MHAFMWPRNGIMKLYSLYLSSVGSEVRKEITIFHKLCDKAEGLLNCDTANQGDDMTILTFSYLFHHLNL